MALCSQVSDSYIFKKLTALGSELTSRGLLLLWSEDTWSQSKEQAHLWSNL